MADESKKSGAPAVRAISVSRKKMDLHILIIPNTLWRSDLRFAYNSTCKDSVSAGFIRINPNTNLHSIRGEITKQLEEMDFLLPNSYTFLRCIGKCLTLVSKKQEEMLKVEIFLPPLAPCPEVYILDAAAATRPSPSLPPVKSGKTVKEHPKRHTNVPPTQHSRLNQRLPSPLSPSGKFPSISQGSQALHQVPDNSLQQYPQSKVFTQQLEVFKRKPAAKRRGTVGFAPETEKVSIGGAGPYTPKRRGTIPIGCSAVDHLLFQNLAALAELQAEGENPHAVAKSHVTKSPDVREKLPTITNAAKLAESEASRKKGPGDQANTASQSRKKFTSMMKGMFPVKSRGEFAVTHDLEKRLSYLTSSTQGDVHSKKVAGTATAPLGPILGNNSMARDKLMNDEPLSDCRKKRPSKDTSLPPQKKMKRGKSGLKSPEKDDPLTLDEEAKLLRNRLSLELPAEFQGDPSTKDRTTGMCRISTVELGKDCGGGGSGMSHTLLGRGLSDVTNATLKTRSDESLVINSAANSMKNGNWWKRHSLDASKLKADTLTGGDSGLIFRKHLVELKNGHHKSPSTSDRNPIAEAGEEGEEEPSHMEDPSHMEILNSKKSEIKVILKGRLDERRASTQLWVQSQQQQEEGEGEGVQQEGERVQQEGEELQQEGVGVQQEGEEEGEELQQEGEELQQEGEELQQEGEELQQEGEELQQEGERLQQEREELQHEEEEGKELQQGEGGEEELQRDKEELQHEEGEGEELQQEREGLQHEGEELQLDGEELQRDREELQHEEREAEEKGVHVGENQEQEGKEPKELNFQGKEALEGPRQKSVTAAASVAAAAPVAAAPGRDGSILDDGMGLASEIYSPLDLSRGSLISRMDSEPGDSGVSAAEVNELLSILRTLKLECKGLTAQKQKVATELRAMHNSVKVQRENVDRAWRKQYYHEQKKSANIEQLVRKARGNSEKIKHLLDRKKQNNMRSALLLQTSTKMKPSEKANIINTCKRHYDSLRNSRATLEEVKAKYATEKKALSNTLTEIKGLRNSLLQKKMSASKTGRSPPYAHLTRKKR